MTAETLKFFMPTTAQRLSDCAKDIKAALEHYRCLLHVENGQIQVVTKDYDSGMTINRG